MMLFKLSAGNLKRSMQNYVVYFVTLIIGVAIFYVFNSIESQTVMLNVSSTTLEIIELMVDALSAVSVFVSFILGFLIVYASNFLMKRRKKEFGVYMLLGMSKKKIAAIIVMETIMIGIVSLGLGLLIGFVGSWGMSVIVANMFESDMTDFTFVISSKAILKTLLYFVVMYLIVIALDTFVVGKAKLINLLNAEKRSEKNNAKNPIVCVIVFAIACVILGTAYYRVTKGMSDGLTMNDLGIQIIKGIIGTFLLFWSISGIFIILAKNNKRMYYKGLNCFSTKELSSRINTSVFSGGIICLLIFFTICIFSSSVAIRQAENAALRDNVRADIMFMINNNDDKYDKEFDVMDILENINIDTSQLKDITEITLYKEDSIGYKDFITKDGFAELQKVYSEQYVDVLRGKFMEVITESDYNSLARLYGSDEVNLAGDRYIFVYNDQYFDFIYNDSLDVNKEITIGEKSLKLADEKYIKGPIYMSNTYENMGVVVVPDSVDISKFEVSTNTVMANYNTKDKEAVKKLNNYFEENYDKMSKTDYAGCPGVECRTRQMYYESAKGITTMIVFIGSYLGIVFMISSGAILSLKELSESVDNKDKYSILRKLGVDEKMINHSLFKQSLIFFGLPLIIAIIHSFFGMQTAMVILEAFGREGLFAAIMLSAVIILVVYGIYFLLTYICSKKIIEE